MLINNNPVQLSEDMLYGKGYHKNVICIPNMQIFVLK